MHNKRTDFTIVTLVVWLPSSMSGGSPPTNTFLENLSSMSKSERGEPFSDELNEGTIWSARKDETC